MNSKDIKYQVNHGLKDGRVRLSVTTDLSLVHHLRVTALNEKDLLEYSPSRIDSVALLKNYIVRVIVQLENKVRIRLASRFEHISDH